MTDDSTNPYCSPAISAAAVSAESAEKRLRFRLVVAIYLVFSGANATLVLWPHLESLIRLISHVALASLTTYWCVLDSRLRRKPIVSSLHWIIFFFWPIAVPMYLIGTRKLRGLGLALVHVAGLLVTAFVTASVAYHVAGFLAYGAAWLDMIRS